MGGSRHGMGRGGPRGRMAMMNRDRNGGGPRGVPAAPAWRRRHGKVTKA